LSAGDEWLGVEVGQTGWRLAKLDDLLLYAGNSKTVTALVARDKRLLRLRLGLPAVGSAAATTWRLAVREWPQSSRGSASINSGSHGDLDPTAPGARCASRGNCHWTWHHGSVLGDTPAVSAILTALGRSRDRFHESHLAGC
jgi:hypothetical protein